MVQWLRLYSLCRGPGFDPWSGNQIPHGTTKTSAAKQIIKYGWLIGKESACQRKRCGFDPWVRKIPWRRKWQPIPVFLPGKFDGQRSLAGYSPQGHKKSNTTAKLNTHMHTHTHTRAILADVFIFSSFSRSIPLVGLHYGWALFLLSCSASSHSETSVSTASKHIKHSNSLMVFCSFKNNQTICF